MIRTLILCLAVSADSWPDYRGDMRAIPPSGGAGTGACAASNWVNSVNLGAPTCSQPAFTDITGAALDAQLTDSYSGVGVCVNKVATALFRDLPPTCTTITSAYTSGTFSPSAHAPSHESGGSDPIPLDTLAAPSDIATLNASTTAHGLQPKLTGLTTDVMRGDGTWGYAPNMAPPVIAAAVDHLRVTPLTTKAPNPLTYRAASRVYCLKNLAGCGPLR